MSQTVALYPPPRQRMGPPGTPHSLSTSPKMSSMLTSVKNSSGEKKRKSLTFYSADAPEALQAPRKREKGAESRWAWPPCSRLGGQVGALSPGDPPLALCARGVAGVGGVAFYLTGKDQGEEDARAHYPGLPSRFFWNSGLSLALSLLPLAPNSGRPPCSSFPSLVRRPSHGDFAGC